MPKKFRAGRQHKSGTGNSTRVASARLLVRPGGRRPLQELDEKGESFDAGASPRAFVEVVCCGLFLCLRA